MAAAPVGTGCPAQGYRGTGGRRGHSSGQRGGPGRSPPPPGQRVASPPPGGGGRPRGGPTGLARCLQHAGLQGRQPAWATTFAARSAGVRPGRAAPQAVAPAPPSLGAGDGGVVDRDGAPCVERVNHDQRMSLVTPRVADRRGWPRLDRDLTVGAPTDEGLEATGAGTPPGGPWSPGRAHRCGTGWPRRWRVGGTGSGAPRTLAPSTSSAYAPDSGCWPV
jgi:hypothetical protein